MTSLNVAIPFNSPLEAGVRSVCILLPAYPQTWDLQRLVVLDHLIVHTGDIGGPESLHAAIPLRTTELLVRRELVERGLLLMISRGLVERCIDESGIGYRAGDVAEVLVQAVESEYLVALRERGRWVFEHFGGLDNRELDGVVGRFFDKWIIQFHEAFGVDGGHS